MIKVGKLEVDEIFIAQQEISSVVCNETEIWSSGNIRTADGYVLVTSDGKTLNVKK